MSDPFDPSHDLRLVREVRERAEPAVSELVLRMRCVPRMLSIQNARLGAPLDAHELADLAQDTALLVLAKLERYAGTSPLEAWMCRISCLELMNAVRRKGYRPIAMADLPDPAGASATTPLDYDDLYRSLERLQDGEADVVRLKHFEELTFDEIGARLGVPANTAKNRYYRALARLERALAPTREEEMRERSSSG